MTPNTLFPGRPNYTGPTIGWFALLHHDTLFEQSHNVNERTDYVRRNKPKNEVALRLHNMVYIGAVAASCEAVALARKAYDEAVATANKAYGEAVATAFKVYDEAVAPARKAYGEAVATANKAYDEASATANKARDEAIATACKAWGEVVAPANAQVLTYVRSVVPDCAWNGTELEGT